MTSTAKDIRDHIVANTTLTSGQVFVGKIQTLGSPAIVAAVIETPLGSNIRTMGSTPAARIQFRLPMIQVMVRAGSRDNDNDDGWKETWDIANEIHQLLMDANEFTINGTTYATIEATTEIMQMVEDSVTELAMFAMNYECWRRGI